MLDICGICGMVGKSDPQLIHAMCDSLTRRGLDDEGIYLDTHTAIGSRQLNIIDLHTGHQSIPYEIERLWFGFTAGGWWSTK